MKEKYQAVEMEAITFDTEDVIITSNEECSWETEEG